MWATITLSSWLLLPGNGMGHAPLSKKPKPMGGRPWPHQRKNKKMPSRTRRPH